jgi:hypothetical protein
MSRFRLIVLALGVVALAACSHHSSSGPNPAPVIANLTVQQAVNSCCGIVKLEADSFDADADLFGGTIVADSNLGPVSTALTICAAGCDPTRQTNRVFIIATYRGRGLAVTGTLYVIDRAGHPSNRLPFAFVSESVHGATDALTLTVTDAGVR